MGWLSALISLGSLIYGIAQNASAAKKQQKYQNEQNKYADNLESFQKEERERSAQEKRRQLLMNYIYNKDAIKGGVPSTTVYDPPSAPDAPDLYGEQMRAAIGQGIGQIASYNFGGGGNTKPSDSINDMNRQKALERQMKTLDYDSLYS